MNDKYSFDMTCLTALKKTWLFLTRCPKIFWHLMLSNMKYVRYLIPYDDMMSCDLSWNYGRQFSSLLSALKKSLDPKPRLIGHRVQVTVKRFANSEHCFHKWFVTFENVCTWHYDRLALIRIHCSPCLVYWTIWAMLLCRVKGPVSVFR